MNVDLLAANLAAHWMQAGLIATAALLALALLRVRNPRLRLAALQTLLWLTVLIPWVQPWRELDAAPSTVTAAASSVAGVTSLAAAPVAAPSTATAMPGANRIAIAIVGFGIAARLAWLAYGALCLFRFRRNGRSIPPPDLATPLEQRLNVSPRYLEHGTPGGPTTFGVFGATIALPAGFAALDPKFQRAIVCHELVHVHRRDPAIALAEEFLTAALWFHPWVWLIRARIRVAREQVVDRTVLQLIGDRAHYVRCLIELSGHDLSPHLATGMLSSRELRTRVDSMFQEGHMSYARALAISIALVAVVCSTSWMAAAHAPLQAMAWSGVERVIPPAPVSPIASLPAIATASAPAPAVAARLQQVAGTVGGGRGSAQTVAPTAPRARTKVAYVEYPPEALDKGISGTVTVNIVVNAVGDVTTAGVIGGPPELRAAAFKAALGLKYAPGPSTTAMTISVTFQLDQQSWGVRIIDRPSPDDAASAAFATASEDRLRAAAQPQQARGNAGAYRVGGPISPPRRIKDVAPVYPPMARSARVQGVVIIETSIDPAGIVTDTRVLRSIPLLDQAAVDAVKQWQYEPTQLNGAAVPLVMTVTVNFTLRDEVRLKITSPNGSTTWMRLQSSAGVAVIDVPEAGRFEFAIAENSGSPTVKVSIAEVSNGARRPIGSVDVAPGTGVVQSATTPSFGIEIDPVSR